MKKIQKANIFEVLHNHPKHDISPREKNRLSPNETISLNKKEVIK
jgi:hypothetical protein